MSSRAISGLVAALLLGLCQPAGAADKVSVGMVGSIGDVPLYIAQERGFFAAENITPDFVPMASLAQEIAPLSIGELDVACGAISAGLYNAVNSDIPLRIVADRGRNAPGYGYNVVLVRKDLVDTKVVRTMADMKGRSIATIGVGSTDMSILEQAMRTVGMGYDDLRQSSLTLPNHAVALQNGAIDATLTPEPFATVIIDKGFAVPLLRVDQFYPDQQQSVMVYGAVFMKSRNDAARRFMVGYLRGVRVYMDALKDGRIAGPGADAVIATIIKYMAFKDADLLRRITPVAIDPDGRVNLAGMTTDWEFLKAAHFIKVNFPPQDIVNMSFAEAAVKQLGPYRHP